ncbi:MAG: hypothetical protein Q7S84_03620 [bacterium]|nr:hypothetical protein [bacterium]
MQISILALISRQQIHSEYFARRYAYMLKLRPMETGEWKFVLSIEVFPDDHSKVLGEFEFEQLLEFPPQVTMSVMDSFFAEPKKKLVALETLVKKYAKFDFEDGVVRIEALHIDYVSNLNMVANKPDAQLLHFPFTSLPK